MTDDLLMCDLVIAVLAVHIDLSEEYNSSDLHVFISHYNQTISVWFSDYWQTYKPMAPWTLTVNKVEVMNRVDLKWKAVVFRN